MAYAYTEIIFIYITGCDGDCELHEGEYPN